MPDTRTPDQVQAELEQATAAQREQMLQSDGDVTDHETLADEREASSRGWVPKDQYKGDPTKWVDAKTFNDRGKRFNSNLQRELEAVKRELQQFKGTAAAFAKHQSELLEQKDKDLKDAVRALKVQRSQASREGEDELAVELDDRIDALNKQRDDLKKVETQPQAPADGVPNPANDPVLLEWIEDGNSWFQDDPKLAKYAVALGEEMLRNGETSRGRPFLDKVRAAMEQDFPRKFRQPEEPTRIPREAVATGGGRAGGSGSYSERDLPAEDLALMKQGISEGWTTKEKFLKGYFEDLGKSKRTYRS